MAVQSLPPWKRPALWLTLAVLIALGGAAAVAIRSVLQARQAAQEAAVVPAPEQVQVVALGRIEPMGRVVDVAPPESGRLGRLMVAEGEQVAVGAVLAYLDTHPLRQAERDYAASQLAEAQAQRQAATELGRSRIEEAQTRISQIDGPQESAIAAQAAAITSLQADLDLAELELQRFQELHDSGAIARQELDRREATVARLEGELANARATLERLERARENDMVNAAAQVDSAQANLSLAQVESRVRSTAQNLARAEAQLELTIIRAPQAGQILKTYAEPGEAVSPSGEPILALGNTDTMYVVAEVYETDISLVEVGQSATITSRNGAFEATLTGTVEEIGLQIFKNDVLDDDPAANADARVVEVRVRVNESDVVAALTNLQVDVAIDVES